MTLANTQIKFCGITNYTDAKNCLDLGIHYLGFNFYKKSKRYIDPIEAKLITRRLPANISLVGVFVNSEKKEIDKIAREVSLDTIQLHGDEDLNFCKSWNELKVIKALRIGLHNKQHCEDFLKVAEHILLDKYSSSEFGGTGKEIEDKLLEDLGQNILSRSFLSGGLTPENVAEKFKKFKPYAVDVASGIEVEEDVRKKDIEKMEVFLRSLQNNRDDRVTE